MKNTYIELLKDPRWQKKRLEILESDYWKCRQCETKDSTLHVHHLYYTKGSKPWEYPNEALITLCEKCHKEAHNINWQQAFLDLNFTPHQLLSMALVMKLKIEKDKIAIANVLNKYKTRIFPSTSITLECDFTKDHDELFEYFDFVRDNKNKYING